LIEKLPFLKLPAGDVAFALGRGKGGAADVVAVDVRCLLRPAAVAQVRAILACALFVFCAGLAVGKAGHGTDAINAREW